MKNLMLLGLFSALFSCFAFPQDLTIRLNLDKKVYLKGEPIFCFAELTNNSGLIRTQPLQGHRKMELILFDSLKNILSRGIEGGAWAFKTGGYDFPQGETETALVEVSSIFGDQPEFGVSLWEWKSLKPGKYFIQAIYTYDDPLTEVKEEKEFLSDVYEMQIVEPQSEADKTVYEILTEESKNGMIEKSYDETRVYAQKLLDLIKKYPDSGYFPGAYFNFFFTIPKDEYRKIDKVIEEMLTKYPDSNMCVIAVSQYETHRNELYRTKAFISKISSRTKRILMGRPGFTERLKEIENSLNN